jgi:hypothetical protein
MTQFERPFRTVFFDIPHTRAVSSPCATDGGAVTRKDPPELHGPFTSVFFR